MTSQQVIGPRNIDWTVGIIGPSRCRNWSRKKRELGWSVFTMESGLELHVFLHTSVFLLYLYFPAYLGKRNRATSPPESKPTLFRGHRSRKYEEIFDTFQLLRSPKKPKKYHIWMIIFSSLLDGSQLAGAYVSGHAIRSRSGRPLRQSSTATVIDGDLLWHSSTAVVIYFIHCHSL